MFQWTRSREMRAAERQREAAADYQERLAEWQIEHEADTHDYTTAQWQRRCEWVRALNAGLDTLTLFFWRHHARAGRVQR